jgi:hypothetical protein
MSFKENYYAKYAKNIYTQSGDDGVIEKLLEDLKITNGVVVEFGAWDGVYLSNVFRLWRYKNFNALLIEGDATKAKEMAETTKTFNNVECVNAFVSPSKEHQESLDNILKRSRFNITNDNLSLISIDVDSCDYYIFDSLVEFSPKIIIIETRTFDGVDIYLEHATFDQGCSLKSVTDLAEKKGYKLVCHNGNAYFVRKDLTHMLPNEDFSFEKLYSSTSDVNIWQSINQYNEKIDGTYYYLQNEYNELISQTKKDMLS